MTPEKKQKERLVLVEGPTFREIVRRSESTIAGCASTGTLPVVVEQLSLPGSDIIEVNCDMCNQEMWTEYYNEGTEFICRVCCELLPR